MGSMQYRIKYILICILFWPFFGTGVAIETTPFEISLNPNVSSDGTATLSWETGQQKSVLIQAGRDPSFTQATTLYRGSDSASVITGLVDGDYFYRGREEYADGRIAPWSETISLHVKHHSLARAGGFFLLGSIVFLATTLLIVFGAKRGGQ
jgi:hypothetical protein